MNRQRVQEHGRRTQLPCLIKQPIEDRGSHVSISPVRRDVHALHLHDPGPERPERTHTHRLSIALCQQQLSVGGW